MNAKDLNRKSETDWERIDRMTDDEIDTSDIPPLDDAFFARATLRLPEKRYAISELLVPRILKHCLLLFQAGFFKNAAHDAMVQVEIALKQKGKITNKTFGANLIGNLFAGQKGVRLRVPLGEELQGEAESYFRGVFSYYRNYTAHDGSKIDEKLALRILILASELLELINASELTLEDSGGVEGLIRIGEFGTADRLGFLLRMLDHYSMFAGSYEGLYENLAANGFSETELEQAIELDLVEMHSGAVETFAGRDEMEVMEWFELTERGQEALETIAAKVP
jgi:hypothetical protein